MGSLVTGMFFRPLEAWRFVIKAKAKTGGSLSTIELDALLGSGSLSDLTGGGGDVGSEVGTKNTPTKKKRRIGVSRRGPRKGNLATKRED